MIKKAGICALAHIQANEAGLGCVSAFIRDCSPRGWLAYVKEPDGEIRLSEFFTGDVGWIVVGARIHPSGYFRNEIR